MVHSSSSKRHGISFVDQDRLDAPNNAGPFKEILKAKNEKIGIAGEQSSEIIAPLNKNEP